MHLRLNRQFYLRKACVAEQPEQAPSDSTVSAQTLLKPQEGGPRLFERRARRINAQQTDVIFTCRDAAARTGHTPHLAQDLLRIRHMFQQVARVDEIETTVWKIEMPRIAPNIGHAWNPDSRRDLLRRLLHSDDSNVIGGRR